MDNQDVGRTRHGKESLHASVCKEQATNTQPRTRGYQCGCGQSKGPKVSSSQSQVEIEIPSLEAVDDMLSLRNFYVNIITF